MLGHKVPYTVLVCISVAFMYWAGSKDRSSAASSAVYTALHMAGLMQACCGRNSHLAGSVCSVPPWQGRSN